MFMMLCMDFHSLQKVLTEETASPLGMAINEDNGQAMAQQGCLIDQKRYLYRVATHPEFVGTEPIFNLMSRIPTRLSRNSTNVPTFKLT